jgi:hypothetical protein
VHATVTRAQPVHRVGALEAAAARLQHTQRWQARQVHVDVASGQPMRAPRIDQQQVRLQRLQRVLGMRADNSSRWPGWPPGPSSGTWRMPSLSAAVHPGCRPAPNRPGSAAGLRAGRKIWAL